MKSIIKSILDKLNLLKKPPDNRQIDTFVSEPNFIADNFENLLDINWMLSKNFKRAEISAKFSHGKYCSILVYPDAELFIGTNVFMNNYCSINCLDKIVIGNDTMFGEGVRLYDHNHIIFNENGNTQISRNSFSKGAIKIGDNCWLGTNVIVLKGVEIGNNVVIGAGCLIHKSVPPNTIVKNKQKLIYS